MAASRTSTLRRFFQILQWEKEEITSIYFFAILYGLVQLSIPLGIQSIISFVMGGSISTSLILLIAFVILCVFASGWLQISQMRLIEKIQQQLFVRYSFQYAYSLPKLNLQKIDNYYMPELLNRFFDTISLQKGISKLLLDFPTATIQLIFGLLLLAFYHPVFIFFGILLVALLYFIFRFTSSGGMQTSIEESNYKYRVAAYLEELGRILTTFKFSKNSVLHLKRTDEYVSGYLHARTSHFRILMFQYRILIGFKVLITAGMLIIGAVLLVDQQLNIGQFIAAELVILTVINSVEKLIVNLDQVYDVMTAIEKIEKVTDLPLENPGTVQPILQQQGMSLSMHNVSFSYNGRENTLNDISLNLQAGEKLCVTGPNASGKSTLLKLLGGSFPEFKGQILIDGLPLHQYDLRALRSQMGIMLNLQDIFEGTLLENLLMGDTEFSYEHINELAAIVGLKPFVDSSQAGYELRLKPAGEHLPGRIVKKILLMRALLHQPRLLLLEEPCLGLEEIYVDNIRNYILSLESTTAVIVSNEQEFLDRCDQVIELKNGYSTRIK